ncbi:MAG: glutathione synthase [Gammaproteobacteria bacterium]|nr:glutathione synthase [Gammaproteobacteria bacterium]
MTLALGIVMDPIGTIKFHKDSTLAMLQAAQARGWQLHYFEMADLAIRDGVAWGRAQPLRVMDDAEHWFELGEPHEGRLGDLDVILMRKDPPFDMEYVYATYILEQAERDGAWVINRPSSLRDANEKVFATRFPDLMPPSLVSRRAEDIRAFLTSHPQAVIKPLGGMGGASVFLLRADDPNAGVIIETLTDGDARYVMVQRFVPEIGQGDKRILLIDGEPVPYALARIPRSGEFRGNLAAGGRGVGVPLSERDRLICARVAPVLRELGLLFVGLDVIGDYLTEINVTSPTCIRELDAQFGLDIAGQLMDAIEGGLAARRGKGKA